METEPQRVILIDIIIFNFGVSFIRAHLFCVLTLYAIIKTSTEMEAKQLTEMDLLEYAQNLTQNARLARYLVKCTRTTLKGRGERICQNLLLWEKVVLLNTYYFLKVSGKLQVDEAEISINN